MASEARAIHRSRPKKSKFGKSAFAPSGRPQAAQNASTASSAGTYPCQREPFFLAPSSSNPLTLSCHVWKKTTRAEKIVKSLIAIAETGNPHSPLATAASTTRTLATCTATEFQYLSATVAALQTELRRSKDESNSKVAAVTDELRKVQEENVALKAAMDEDRAPRIDDEIKQQLEKLTKELEEVRNENAAHRTQPPLDQETPSLSTTSVTQLQKIVSDFMAYQTLTQAETSKQIAELGRIVAKVARNCEELNRAQTTIQRQRPPVAPSSPPQSNDANVPPS